MLWHIARYRLSTREIMGRLFAPELKDPIEGIKRPLEELRTNGLIVDEPFEIAPNQLYFHLTVAGARALALDEGLAQTSSRHLHRCERYAALVFCAERPERRLRFMRDDFEKAFPGQLKTAGGEPTALGQVFPGHAYYIDTEAPDGRARLARILLHTPKHRPLDILAQALEQMEKVLPHFLAADRLALALVTAYEETRERLLYELSRKPLLGPYGPVFCNVEAHPEMQPLLAAGSASEQAGAGR